MPKKLKQTVIEIFLQKYFLNWMKSSNVPVVTLTKNEEKIFILLLLIHICKYTNIYTQKMRSQTSLLIRRITFITHIVVDWLQC